ncbi:hypothetical protein HJC23_007445 [Cyclotella cryptica]|uniref:Fucoxanthin chlorophyll a/c binding protein n=1 Tax=Cyclotella cryptica TaxID=29204 RepID=A0ABD3QIY2_9STRA|eukprot:CCRYP_005197-RA/>CCRYP_005197-RA protein AED:0.06 eAED:0.06 QI:192/1/1/1/1/1/2/272/136
MKTALLISILSFNKAIAFIPSGVPVAWGQGTSLSFGLPSFGGKSDEKDDSTDKKEKKISAGGLLQLITAGMGAPFLGDFEGVDEETGKFMFSLEANNLVDENGQSKQTQMPYFENGWVEEKDGSASSGGFRFPWEK